MSILKVARMGHPALRECARPVLSQEVSSAGIQDLVGNMKTTMQEYSGVGLAAPQVHVSKRIVVVDIGSNGEGPEILAMINPTLRPLTPSKVVDWEGCLSIPEIRGEVPRWEQILVQGVGESGNCLCFEAEGFPARVIQHEIDHLDGILFLDRMAEFKSLTYLDEFVRYRQD